MAAIDALPGSILPYLNGSGTDVLEFNSSAISMGASSPRSPMTNADSLFLNADSGQRMNLLKL